MTELVLKVAFCLLSSGVFALCSKKIPSIQIQNSCARQEGADFFYETHVAGTLNPIKHR